MIPWEIQGRELTNCNCAYGCPCQFNALPTHGNCEAAIGYIVDSGHFGDVRLDGLRAAFVMQWPGPIHEGHGKAFIVIDERANEAQRNALLTIFSGQETEPGKTVFNVFAATLEKVFDPEFRKIDAEIDVERRRGRVVVEGVMEITGEPIKNPVTGQEHRARIDLPEGFEYRVAEMGSASSTVQGPIPLTLNNSYGQFNYLHISQSGVVGQRSAA